MLVDKLYDDIINNDPEQFVRDFNNDSFKSRFICNTSDKSKARNELNFFISMAIVSGLSITIEIAKSYSNRDMIGAFYLMGDNKKEYIIRRKMNNFQKNSISFNNRVYTLEDISNMTKEIKRKLCYTNSLQDSPENDDVFLNEIEKGNIRFTDVYSCHRKYTIKTSEQLLKLIKLKSFESNYIESYSGRQQEYINIISVLRNCSLIIDNDVVKELMRVCEKNNYKRGYNYYMQTSNLFSRLTKLYKKGRLPKVTDPNIILLFELS